MVQVSRVGQSDHRVDQQVGLDLASRPEREFLVRAVHRLAGLIRHHLAPAQPRELGSQFLGRAPQPLEVVVARQLYPLHRAAHVVSVASLQQVADTRVLGVEGAVHRLRLRPPVRFPYIFHREGRDHDALGVAQRELRSRLEHFGQLRGHVQGHRYGPQRPAGKPHRIAHRLIVVLAEEAGERRERAVHQHLQVT